LEKNPKCVVLMIGINDLLQGQTVDTMKKNYRKVCKQLESIDTVVILSLLPVQMMPQTFEINEKVILLNHFLKQESRERHFTYLDLYSTMVDEKGGIKASLSSDGVHLTPKAYTLWENILTIDGGLTPSI
jgi:lysophospholipase L1-like esterase